MYLALFHFTTEQQLQNERLNAQYNGFNHYLLHLLNTAVKFPTKKAMFHLNVKKSNLPFSETTYVSDCSLWPDISLNLIKPKHSCSTSKCKARETAIHWKLFFNKPQV